MSKSSRNFILLFLFCLISLSVVASVGRRMNARQEIASQPDVTPDTREDQATFIGPLQNTQNTENDEDDPAAIAVSEIGEAEPVAEIPNPEAGAADILKQLELL